MGDGQDTSDRRRAALALSLLVAAATSAACAGPKAPTWTPERIAQAEHLERVLAASAERRTAGGSSQDLRVRLAFGSEADLDLYVTDTDPRVSETVYFARHESRAGGRLLRDARCSDAVPRIDAVLYVAPLAPGYRIGVDHHRSCGEHAVEAVFVVEWTSGEQRRTRRGIATPGHFDDRFWMLVPDGKPGARGSAAPSP